MRTITLHGGPHDGRTVTVGDDYFAVINTAVLIETESHWATYRTDSYDAQTGNWLSGTERDPE